MTLTPHIQIGNHLISADRPSYIIAELSANHGGDLEVALNSVRAIAKTGANAVKVQTYSADSMTLDIDDQRFMTRPDSLWAGRRMHDLYREGSLPLEWHQPIQHCANELGLDFFSSPFDPATVDFLQQLDVPAFKIASLEITDIPLIRRAAATGKPIILSSGIASEEDLALAINTCHKEGNQQLAVLQCTTQYPSRPEQTNLRSIPWIAQQYNVVSGLSDHSMGITAAIAAVPLGCAIIEKHFILDKSLGTLDDQFSLDPGEFTALVSGVREAEQMLGNPGYHYTEIRQQSRRSSRSLIAIEDIAAGDVFSLDNIRILRPCIGLPPRYLDNILGKTASCDIARGDGLVAESINDFSKD